jgi:hypothetical protein
MNASPKTVNQLNKFIEKITKEFSMYMLQNFQSSESPVFTVKEGPKFFKIVKIENESHRAFCFVDKNGNIYKPAGWKTPEKHIFGSIFDKNFGWGTAIGIYGVGNSKA